MRDDRAATLAERMRAYAMEHPQHREILIKHAKSLDEVDTSDVKKLLGTWARARRIWCEISGEPLV